MTNNKTSRSKQTKRRIMQTYLTLILKKQWDKITVKELCSNSDITRGTFYQYYSDIYELMEHIQAWLIQDLIQRYEAADTISQPPYRLEDFVEKYHYEPPGAFVAWYQFCLEHKQAIHALLNPTNGDVYFQKKLKTVISKYINQIMDRDGLPRDELRSYFVHAFTELHLFSVRTWFNSPDEESVSVLDIVNLLNTMRVGAGYLTFKLGTAKPEFKKKIDIPEESRTPNIEIRE